MLAREQKAGRPPSTSLAKLVEEALERHRHLLERKTIEVKLQFQADLQLAADRALLLIVVGNLIRNAFQHTDRGEVNIGITGAELRVADTGSGIPEAQLERIFQRHYKGSDSRGEGIGLSLTKRICDHYGWTIGVESHPARGTEVRLDFGMTSGTVL